MDETQLPLHLKVSFIHLLPPKMEWMKLNIPRIKVSLIVLAPETQNGIDETQLSFEFKVSFIHLLHPENCRWNG